MTALPIMPMYLQRDRFDPVPELARIRERTPVTRITLASDVEAWLVTSYRGVREVLGDPTRFSNRGLAALGPFVEPAADSPDTSTSAGGQGIEGSGFLLAYDPPEHTRLRRMITPEFTTAKLRWMNPRIEAIVAEHLATMAAAGGPIDLVLSFALPMPSLVICELLGVPYDRREELQRQSRLRLDLSASFELRAQATRDTTAAMADVVTAQRSHPGDDLLGMLVRNHGDELTDRELAGIADLLLMAGHETTSNMLGLGALLLLRYPDHLALVRQPERMDAALEEMLRYLSVAQSAAPRTAVTDVEIDGQLVKAGEMVVCSLPVANRDPALGAGLDGFDPAREVISHLAFGHGMHRCLGAPLARTEMRIAYPALFERFPTLRLAVPFEEVPFCSFQGVHGLESLPVTW